MELLKKLNYKDQDEIVILNAPENFKCIIDEIKKSIQITEDENSYTEIDFILVFTKDVDDIEKYAELVLPKAADNAVIWFAYLKQSAMSYGADLASEDGWDIIGEYQFEPVRQISIDNEWVALRLRPAKNIKNFTRNESTVIGSEEKIKPKKKLEYY